MDETDETRYDHVRTFWGFLAALRPGCQWFLVMIAVTGLALLASWISDKAGNYPASTAMLIGLAILWTIIVLLAVGMWFSNQTVKHITQGARLVADVAKPAAQLGVAAQDAATAYLSDLTRVYRDGAQAGRLAPGGQAPVLPFPDQAQGWQLPELQTYAPGVTIDAEPYEEQ